MQYSFESPEAFLADFGVPATFGSFAAKVILNEPDREILGTFAQSTMYEIEYVTTDLPGLVLGNQITVNGQLFYVNANPEAQDDGTFSKCKLQVGA